MCLMVPGKIVQIEHDVATLDYGPEQRKGTVLEGDFKVGDYALVQGGILVEKIPKEEAEQALALYRQAVSQ